MKVVGPDSHVTLHYRLYVYAGGSEQEIISTFGNRPATVQIGAGHLAVPLERRLFGLAEGQQAAFDMTPAEAFGERDAGRVQRVGQAAFETNADPSADYALGDVVEFDCPGGGRVAGVLKQRDAGSVVVDFNHPLAGQPKRFAVQVVGVI